MENYGGQEHSYGHASKIYEGIMLAQVEVEKRPFGGLTQRFVDMFNGSVAFPAAMSHLKCFYFACFYSCSCCTLYLQH